MTAYWPALLKTLARFSARGGFIRSSHVALSLMLAIFPFCIFALSFAGLFTKEADAAYLMDFVFGSWPEAVAAPIEKEVTAVLKGGGGSMLTYGALLTLFFASNGVEAIRLAVTTAYHDTDVRPWWKTRFLSVGFVIGGAILITASGVVSLVVPIYLALVDEVLPGVYLGFLSSDWTRVTITGFSMLFAVFACHKWLSGVGRPAKTLLPGIALTVMCWSVAAKGFEYYLSNFASYSVTYAGLAGVMAALVFLYAMAVIFVFGAEFNGRLAEVRETAKTA